MRQNLTLFVSCFLSVQYEKRVFGLDQRRVIKLVVYKTPYLLYSWINLGIVTPQSACFLRKYDVFTALAENMSFKKMFLRLEKSFSFETI